MRRIPWWSVGWLVLALAPNTGCSSQVEPSSSNDAQDASTTDAADGGDNGDVAAPDTTQQDVARPDAGVDGSDGDGDGPEAEAGPDDAGAEPEADATGDDAPACVPLDGLGVVACSCNAIDDAVWNSSTPLLLQNSVDLGTTGWDPAQLTPGGQKIVADGNLGGSSVESEALAYDVLARCEFATLLKSEGEILYTDNGGKKTDELVSIDARKVGVSVTRAYHYPPTDPCTPAEAQALLTKKLGDIPLSAANAAPSDAWERSILAVVAVTQQCADVYAQQWGQLDAALKGDTIVVLTVTDGEDSAIY